MRQAKSTVRRVPLSGSPALLSRAVRGALTGGKTTLCIAAGLAAAGVTVGSNDATAATFPPVIQLRSLHPGAGGDGSQGFILKGIDVSDVSGGSVSDAGDFNGDQIDDVIVGASLADPNDRSRAGESYVVFGRATGFPAAFELRNLQPSLGGDGTDGFILRGIDPYDYSGRVVSSAGDINGDGVDDIVIGADSADPNGQSKAGETYVVFGRTTGFPAAFELRSLHPAMGGDGSDGFILTGIDPNDYSGRSASRAGDVNGDGIDDLIVGASSADPNGQRNAGETYVVFGRTTGFPALFELRRLHPALGGDGSEGFILRGIDSSDVSGLSLAAAGDVNGDGIDDLIIGAYSADPNGRVGAGESYVVFGRTTGFPAAFELAALDPASGGDGSEGFILEGIDSRDNSGTVSGAGDVNGDGTDDLLIGAVDADPNGRFGAGESYVVFGRTTGFPAAFELGALEPASGGDGSEGFVVNGIGINENDYSGGSLSGAGDVNGDGLDDLIIGASSADPDGRVNAGGSYVVFGRTTGFQATFELSGLLPARGGDGSEGFILKGIDPHDYLGPVSGGGDVNGDGVADVIIGARRADANDMSDSGETYVVFGRAPVSH